MGNSNSMHIDDYFVLLKGLEIKEKLQLIAKLTESLLEEDTKKEERFFNLAGKWETEESAEELVEKIQAARYFNREDVEL
jgi:hypothetical protein